MTTVIALVGPSGVGKTTVAGHILARGELMSERYREADHFQLDNRTVLSKWNYIAEWFNRVLVARQRNIALLIADRSPYDTGAYATGGHVLIRPLEQSFAELDALGVAVRFAYLHAPENVLRSRIEARLAVEQWRKAYHEPELLRQSIEFFESHSKLWHVRIDATTDASEVAKSVEQFIQAQGL